MVIADLIDGNVTAMGQFVGRLDSKQAMGFLRACKRHQMSAVLQAEVFKIVIDKGKCPICGRSDSFVKKIVIDGVAIGYCLNCNENLAISNNNEWTSIWHEKHTGGQKSIVDIRQ